MGTGRVKSHGGQPVPLCGTDPSKNGEEVGSRVELWVGGWQIAYGGGGRMALTLALAAAAALAPSLRDGQPFARGAEVAQT